MEPIEIFSKIQGLIQNQVDTAIKAYADQSKFGVFNIPAHEHTGVDSAKINFENIEGVPLMTAVPTDLPTNGTIRLYDDLTDRKLYAFINGVWYSTTLT